MSSEKEESREIKGEMKVQLEKSSDRERLHKSQPTSQDDRGRSRRRAARKVEDGGR